MGYQGNSIVDYLKSVGQDSTYNNRKKLAAQYGISNYSGTAAQNTSLLNTLRNGAKSSTASSSASSTPVTQSSPTVSSSANYVPTQTQSTGLNGVSSATATKLAGYESGYKQSDAVSQAYSYLQSVQNNKPGAFSSNYETQLNDIYNKIMNRKDFSYDLNGDALYNQYKDQYMNLGQTAMQDTMGQAAALTGGYGNSYASTAGNQAYQNYLAQLNDKVPELYNQAYQKYQDEGQNLYNQYGLANDAYGRDYSQYRDKVADYQNDYSNAFNAYNSERDFDYNDYSNMLSYYQSKAGQEQDQYNWQQNYDYQASRDSVADSQWAQELAYQKARDAVADSQWAKEYALSQAAQAAKSASSSSKSSSSKSGSSSTSSKSGITAGIRNKCASFTSESSLAKYLDQQEKTGAISSDESDLLFDVYATYAKEKLDSQKFVMDTTKSGISSSLYNRLDEEIKKEAAQRGILLTY